MVTGLSDADRGPAARGLPEPPARVTELRVEQTSPHLGDVWGGRRSEERALWAWAWAWGAPVPGPTRPFLLSLGPGSRGPPSSPSCWEAAAFLPKEPLGSPDSPPLGPGSPGASPGPAGTAGGQAVALSPRSGWQLGPSTHRADCRVLHREAPAQRGPGPAEAPPWTCQALLPTLLRTFPSSGVLRRCQRPLP